MFIFDSIVLVFIELYSLATNNIYTNPKMYNIQINSILMLFTHNKKSKG